MGYYTNKSESLVLVTASIAYIDGTGPRPSMPEGYLKPKPLTAKRDPGGPRSYAIQRAVWDTVASLYVPVNAVPVRLEAMPAVVQGSKIFR